MTKCRDQLPRSRCDDVNDRNQSVVGHNQKCKTKTKRQKNSRGRENLRRGWCNSCHAVSSITTVLSVVNGRMLYAFRY